MASANLPTTPGGVPYPGARPRGRSLGSLAARVELERIARALAAAGLLVLLAAGSVAAWTAIPVGCLWLVSRLSATSAQLPLGPSLAAAVSIPAAMAGAVGGLAALEGVYARLSGSAAMTRLVAPGWRRSISDSPSHPPATVLEKLMGANVLVAVGALIVWFFAFAGSSVPW